MTVAGGPSSRIFRFRMSQEAVITRCVVCELESTRRCSQCRIVYYCSQEHQHEDWKRHKRDCFKIPKNRGKKAKSEIVKTTATVQGTTRSANVEQRIPTPNNIDENEINQTENIQKGGRVGAIYKKESTIEGNNTSPCRRNEQTARGTPSCSSRSDSGQTVLNLSKKLGEDRISSVGTDNEAITYEGSSENEILRASTQQIISSVELSSGAIGTSNVLKVVNRADVGNMLAMPGYTMEPARQGPRETADVNPFCHNTDSIVKEPSDPDYEVCQQVIRDMTAYGVCVLDNFVGPDRGMLVLNEVLNMYRQGIFQAGQLVSNPRCTEAQTIRSDRITWIHGREPHCVNIGMLIQQVDNIILRANKMSNNGKMGDYNITGRTKAMVACYPGGGSRYVKHVDNPNKDGRCITAIYYLNRDWDVKQCGGMLRVFPEGDLKVANIAPLFDRMLFFWSDRRNPHEVEPAFDTRYAITLWYFDAQEREEATRRYREKQSN